MSHLLDALRKTDRAGQTIHRTLQPARSESVLASMGYRTRRPAGGLKVVAGFMGLLALSVFMWTLNSMGVRGTGHTVPSTRIARPEPLTTARTEGEPAAARPMMPLATVAQPAPAPPPRSPLEDFRRAVRYHEAGDLNRAVEVYQSLLARDALQAEVHNNLGLVHQARGNFDGAAREFQQALSLDPAYAKAHNNFGVLLLAQRRIEAAIASFQAAARADRSDIGSLINLGLAQKAAGWPERAAETLLSALSISPHSALAHYNLAVLYDGSGERARASEHYRAFLEHRGSAYASQAADVEARLAALDSSR